MAPNGEAIARSPQPKNFIKPPRLDKDSLKRTISDISHELMNHQEAVVAMAAAGGGGGDHNASTKDVQKQLPPISEVESAKCQCCCMSEECTPEYIARVREKYLGKWICGLCAEAVKLEMEKNGGKIEEALNSHMSACVRFNKFGRAYPILCQAEAMREILKKGSKLRSKSMSPKDHKNGMKIGGIARSSSCIPAITRENINDLN